MVTTGNRSRIRFKDPREIRAIVCPTPPPPLHPISPFLSLLNFETSWGVSIYTRIHAYIVLLLILLLRDTRATFLRDQTIENLLPFVHRPSRRRKRKKRRRRKEIVETRLFYSGNKRIKVFRTFKNRVAPGKDVTRIVRDFFF